MAKDAAADVVDPLAFVSRGDTGRTALEAPEPASQKLEETPVTLAGCRPLLPCIPGPASLDISSPALTKWLNVSRINRGFDRNKARMSLGLETAKDQDYSVASCLNAAYTIARIESLRWAAQSRRATASLDCFVRQFAAPPQ
jgi:hypothetical protein